MDSFEDLPHIDMDEHSEWPDGKMHLENKMMKKGHFPKKEDNEQFNKITM